MTTAEIVYSLILIATILAIILGPILAAWMTRHHDTIRETRQRKLDVYRTIMQTRASRLAIDHVRALNLIPVEFYGDDAVMSAFREYMNILFAPLPPVDQQERFAEQREDKFLDLTYQLGVHLGYDFDRRELGRLAYAPQGYAIDEERARRSQVLLGEMLEGQRPLPVTWVVPTGPQNPFPPTPEPVVPQPPQRHATK